MGDVSRKGDEKDKWGGSSRCDRQSVFVWQITGGLRNWEKWKLAKIEKNWRRKLPYGIIASRNSLAMIGWSGACFSFSFSIL